MKYVVIPCLAAAVILLIYLFIENFFMLTVRKVTTGKGLRIAQISDIHKKSYRGGKSRISERVRDEKPDMIFVTGDFVSRDETDLTSAEKLLKELCKIAPVYFIFGNHEQSLPENIQAEFTEMLARTEAIVLRNRTVKAEIKGRSINICGLEPPYTTYKKNECYRDLDSITAEDMKALIGERPEGETLLLAHNPLFAEAYSQWGADCTFSGHVHGGAVRIFGIGILSPERRFFPKYTKGVYDIGGMKLMVSAGIGKLRAFDPPEIVIYEI